MSSGRRVGGEDMAESMPIDCFPAALSYPPYTLSCSSELQGIFFFNYVLRNRVRLDMEAPVLVTYSAAVLPPPIPLTRRHSLSHAFHRFNMFSFREVELLEFAGFLPESAELRIHGVSNPRELVRYAGEALPIGAKRSGACRGVPMQLFLPVTSPKLFLIICQATPV